MKLNRINSLWIIWGMLTMLAGCRDTEFADGPVLKVEEGIPGTLVLPVNTSSMTSHVVTRSTAAATDEEKHISTLYVFIVDIQDKDNPAANPILAKRWFSDVSKLRDTDGHIRVSIPAVSCNQVRVFAVANLNTPNQLANNSELLEQYNRVSNEEELEEVRAVLNTESNYDWVLADRSQGNLPASGHFRRDNDTSDEYPLAAQEEIYTLAANNGTLQLQDGSGMPVSGAIRLHRLDAKIRFEVKLADNLPAGAYFKLKSWQVINLHKQAFIHWQHGDACGTNTSYEYVGDSDEMTGSYISETQNAEGKTVSEFTFYALENRHKPKTEFATAQQIIDAMTAEGYSLPAFTGADQAYVLREKNELNPSGYTSFKYAPRAGTYVVLKGEFYTPVTHAPGSENMQRAANVEYAIHLGYIGQGNMEGTGSADNEIDKLNDYSILRNSSYTYKVTVKEVDNIRVEAQKQGDPQPSAEGSVIDSEFDLQADSHYEQRLIAFDLKEVAEKIKEASAHFSYTVKTPFTDGEQTVTVQTTGDDDRPQNLDDQWVHFVYLGNDASGSMSMATMEVLEKSGGYGLPYAYTYTTRPSESQVTSNPFQLWPATTLLRNLQAWINTYNAATDKTIKGEGVRAHIMLDNGSPFYLTRFFTVYVDEYYYTQNPNTGTVSNTLWTQFCNTGDRTMRVFLQNFTSNDGWSSYSRSGLNIRQKAIQTAYSPGETGQQLADRAYGIEHTDEYGKNYNIDVTDAFTTFSTHAETGLANSLNALYSPLSQDILGKGFLWESFYNLFNFNARTSEGQIPAATTDQVRRQRYAHLAHLTRNRDNNRNGIIDPEEVKWYIPTHRQMQNLYLGSFLMDDPLFAAKLLKNNRVCYLTSYADASGMRFLIADEGASLGIYSILGNAAKDSYVRCARSLGTPPDVSPTWPYNSSIPEALATTVLSGSNHTITHNKYSTRGMRSYIERGALGSHTQHQSLARTYRSFIVAQRMIYAKNADGSLDSAGGVPSITWTNANDICPLYSEQPDRSDLGTWRLPNLSEALSMLLHLPPVGMWNDVGFMWTCTRCSQNAGEYFGIERGEVKHQTSASTGYVRCVHDLKE